MQLDRSQLQSPLSSFESFGVGFGQFLVDHTNAYTTAKLAATEVRDRFLCISLELGEIGAVDRRSKIEPLLKLLLPNFRKAYIPVKQLSADESVITFKGLVSFRQYLKGKPNTGYKSLRTGRK